MTPLAFHLMALCLVVGIVWGIHLMNKPRTAVGGNRLGALCLLAAIVLTMAYYDILGAAWLWASMAIGGAIGYIWSLRVQMIKMPQLVAVFNGFGGLASSLVAFLLLTGTGAEKGFSLVTASIALAIGAITFSGSAVAAAKLNQWISQRPIVVKKHSAVTALSLGFLILLLVLIAAAGDPGRNLLTALIAVTSLFIGLFFTIRVGGADMPVTISLLNSLSGVAGAIAGMAIRDPLLVAVGGVVGASGLLLTQVMCRSMNRSVLDVLGGRTAVQAGSKPAAVEARGDVPALAESGAPSGSAREEKADTESILREALRVVIVPGYGMALSQAQHLVKKLADRLKELGKDVKYAIHPVAGRMPGHMNVLLAEADVPYEELYEMDVINPLFRETDVALVIGANDVVNPAAITAKGTPIYGMPILQVEGARHVIICNYDDKPGYSGVENPLYRNKQVILILGDASESLAKIISGLEG